MMSPRIAAGLFVAASLGGVAALATPASAAPAAASGSCYFYDNQNNMPGACADETTNYSEGNVGVWNDPDNPTTRVATGSAGQVFESFPDYVSNGRPTTCDNGVTTSYWYHGIDAVSGQTGWVPDCYLNGEPS